MAKQKEAWDKLSMLEKALLIKLSIDNGVSSLELIRDTYNLYSSDLNHKYAGDIESTQNLSFIGKDRFQDIAYRIMSQSSAEKRQIKDIFKAVKESYTNADYELNYTGANPYMFHNKLDPDSRDSNWLFLYGNTKGQYTPITKEELRGHSYAPFIKKHYPNKEVLNYYGQITPLNEVVIPTYMRPLVDFLVKNDFGTYDSWVEPSDNVVQDALKRGYYVDDVGAFRTGIGHSPSGELELQLSDLTDFGGGDYDSRYGIIAGIQGDLLNKVGNPFMLRLFIPARYSINTTEHTPGIEATILNMARDNGVSTYDNTTDTYYILGSLPELEVYGHEKSTGGPLYPFSFEKNPFLKTPVVRYDEGGFFARLFGKKDASPTPEEIKEDRVERFINDTWETEYSIPRGYDPTTGLFYPYNSPEGGTKTIGPGFKLRKDGSGDATMFTAKEAARGVTREQINEKLRAQGELQYDKVLEFLNQKGNRLPVDTINPNIMNGLMDLRFLVGTLGGWNNLREAVLNGDLEGIKKESKVTFKDEKTGKIKVDTRRNDLRAEKFWHYD